MPHTTTTETAMRAYAVTWQKLPDIEVLIAAETAGKACYAAWLLCHDVYREARFFEMRAVRAPRFDGLPARYDGRIFQSDGFEPETVEYFGAPVRLP